MLPDPSADLLMEPGPTLVDPRVIDQLATPPVHHLDPRFVTAFDDLSERLASIVGAPRPAIVLPCSGRGGVEGVFASLPRGGGRVLVLSNGEFGAMLAQIARRHAASVVEIVPEDPTGIHDPGLVSAAIGRTRPDAVAVVHNESSTGVLNDLREIGALTRRAGALFIVDAISSAGGTPVDVGDPSIDLCVLAPQKALGAVTGLAAVTVSERARRLIVDRSDESGSYYFDLGRWWRSWATSSAGGHADPRTRRLPWSMPTHLVLAWRRAMQLIEEETLPLRWQRHAALAEAFRRTAAELGFELWAPAAAASPTLTSLVPPVGITAPEVRAQMAERHRIRIAGGFGPLRERVLRVAHMGESARPEPLARTLSALGSILGAGLSYADVLARLQSALPIGLEGLWCAPTSGRLSVNLQEGQQCQR